MDVSIQYADGGGGRLLAHEAIQPVAAPGYATHILTLRDLAACPLLERVDAPWSAWLDLVATRCPPVVPRLTSDDWRVPIDAAKAGQGVLLARSFLVESEIEAGSLVSSPYYCLWHAGSPKIGVIEAFTGWLEGELQPRKSVGPRRQGPKTAGFGAQ